MNLKQIEHIEKELRDFTYDEIPEKMIQLIQRKFDAYSYLMSVLESKKVAKTQTISLQSVRQ